MTGIARRILLFTQSLMAKRRRWILHLKLRKQRKKQLKHEAKRKRRYEKARRKLTDHPRMRTVADYAKDAQRDRVLLRFRGRNVPGARTAIANRAVLRRRYKRTLEFAGKGDGGWYGLFALALLGAGVGVGLLVYFFYKYNDPTGTKPGDPLVNALVGGAAGGGIGVVGLFGIYFRRMWTRTYTLVHVVEHAIKSKPWVLTAIVRVYLPRLAFAAHDYGRVFSGGARTSGIMEGDVILQLPDGVRASSLQNVRDVYALQKKEGRYSGTSTRAIDGRVERVVNLSKRRAALKAPEKHAWLDKAGPYVVIVIALVVLFMQNSGGG